MKCEELLPLRGAYLDSELDAKTTLQIQQHLAACPECARGLAIEGLQNARVTTGLKRGQRTEALWDQIERRVATAAVHPPSASHREPTLAATLRLRLRELLWPHPRAWAGLAAAWLLVLTTSFFTRDPGGATAARQVSSPSRQARELLQEQRRMLAELSGLTDSRATEQPGGAAPQPRSQPQKHHPPI